MGTCSRWTKLHQISIYALNPIRKVFSWSEILKSSVLFFWSNLSHLIDLCVFFIHYLRKCRIPQHNWPVSLQAGCSHVVVVDSITGDNFTNYLHLLPPKCSSKIFWSCFNRFSKAITDVDFQGLYSFVVFIWEN